MRASKERHTIIGSGESISLKDHLRHGPISVEAAVAIAEKIATALAPLHDRGLQIKGLSPVTLFIHGTTGVRPLAISHQFVMDGLLQEDDETEGLCPVDIEKTTLLRDYLPYIAPEQTGRGDHAPDHRMDLYALGVLLFEMLTGTPPFTQKTVLKTLHAHMATPVPDPCHLNPEIPAPLADLTVKLLQKSPNARYQSAKGLLADLANCREKLHTLGTIPPFPLAAYDHTEAFPSGPAIYGREKEQDLLCTARNDARRGGSPKIWIEGEPGMGKTRLVMEHFKGWHDEEGLFLSVKFESSQDEAPYGFLTRLLEKGLQHILSSDPDALRIWQGALSRHVAPHARILTELIPGMAPILGPGTPAPPLPPAETRVRLTSAFKGVLRALAETAPPLVLFFDDLQWACADTLALITALLVEEPVAATLFIGAFRTHTPSSAPHLAPWLEALTCPKRPTPRLLLPGLTAGQIRQLLVETLHRPDPEIDTLARIMEEKSKGNPLFIRGLLASLYENGLIFFHGGWRVNLQGIEALNLTDDILTILGQRIEELSPPHRHTLELAACIGIEFDDAFIARLTDGAKEATKASLALLTHHELLVKASSGYRISHDRVHEAVITRLSAVEKSAHHHRIGTLLVRIHEGMLSGPPLFETVNHLNRGYTEIKDNPERIALARLNLKAAMAARNQAAFENALGYAEMGLTLLTESSGRDPAPLTLYLTVEAGDAAHQMKERERADALLATALSLAREAHHPSPHMIVRIHTITIRSRIRSGDVVKAYALALSALKAMGEKLPQRIGKIATIHEFIKAQASLWGEEIPALANRPELTDPTQKAVAQLYKLTIEVGYIASPKSLPFMALKCLNHTLRHGVSAHGAFAASFYGMMLCSSGLSIDKGFQFGELGLALLKKYPDPIQEGEVHLLFGGMICHWKRPYQTGRPYLDHALRCAKETGNFPLAAYSINHILILHEHLGTSLTHYLQENEGFARQMDHFKQGRSHQGFQFGTQYLVNLTTPDPDFKDFKGPLFHERQMEKKRVEKDQTAIGNMATFKGMLYYLSGRYHEAAEIMALGVPALPGIAGTLFVPDFYLFYALSLAAIYPQKGRWARGRSLWVMTRALKKLRRWALHAPENFNCRALLVQAEIARIQGRSADAMALYENAIASAQENGFSQIEGVGCECAFTFHLAEKREHLATIYLTRAREAFTAWGALAKVAQLEASWPQFLAPPPAPHHRTPQEPDLVSIIQASQAIAGETNLGKLMERLMAIVIENAGARVGSLILTGEDDALTVEARVGAEKMSPHPLPFDAMDETAQGIIRYVIRTRATVARPAWEGTVPPLSSLAGRGPRSLLCMPLMEGAHTLGALYLENDLLDRAFSLSRVEILKTVTDILAHARAKQRAEEEVILYQKRLRGLSSQLLLTEERERRRIAVGLHDEIGQALTLSRLKLSALKNSLPGEDIKNELRQISRLVDQTIGDIRHLTFELSPPDLYELGLAAALDTLAEEMLTPHGIKIDFADALGEMTPIPESDRILLYQAAREVLFNIIKHAQATRVDLCIKSDDTTIEISITDNGKGFDIGQTMTKRHKTKGFGLFSIKERLVHHGGRITLTPGPVRGTRVVLSLPCCVKKNHRGTAESGA